jgi:Uma2 family endonuclease
MIHAPASHTWEDFVALDEDDRRELIDGELVEIEMPSSPHERLVALLAYFFEAWARAGGGGRTFASGLKVRVSERRGLMPDLQFYRPDNRPAGRSGAVVDGRPDLAIEIISPSSVRYDRVIKLGYYASIGVPEYWLVDIENETVERLVLDGDRYRIESALSGDEVLSPTTFPGLAIPLMELWAAAAEARVDEGA